MQRGPKAVSLRASSIKRKEEETFGRKRRWDRLLELLPGNEEVADVLLSLMRPPEGYDIDGDDQGGRGGEVVGTEVGEGDNDSAQPPDEWLGDWNDGQDDDSIAWSDDPSVSGSSVTSRRSDSCSEDDDSTPPAASPSGPLHLLPSPPPPRRPSQTWRGPSP